MLPTSERCRYFLGRPGEGNSVELVDGCHGEPAGVAQAAKLHKRIFGDDGPFVMVEVSPIPDIDVPINEEATDACAELVRGPSSSSRRRPRSSRWSRSSSGSCPLHNAALAPPPSSVEGGRGKIAVAFEAAEAEALFIHLNDSGCGRRDGYTEEDIAKVDAAHKALGLACATVLDVGEARPRHEVYANPLGGGWDGYQAACHDCTWTGTRVWEDKDAALLDAQRHNPPHAPPPSSVETPRGIDRGKAVHAVARQLCFQRHGDYRYDPGNPKHEKWAEKADFLVETAWPFLVPPSSVETGDSHAAAVDALAAYFEDQSTEAEESKADWRHEAEHVMEALASGNLPPSSVETGGARELLEAMHKTLTAGGMVTLAARLRAAIDALTAPPMETGGRCVCNIDGDGTPIYPDGQGAPDCPFCGGSGRAEPPCATLVRAHDSSGVYVEVERRRVARVPFGMVAKVHGFEPKPTDAAPVETGVGDIAARIATTVGDLHVLHEDGPPEPVNPTALVEHVLQVAEQLRETGDGREHACAWCPVEVRDLSAVAGNANRALRDALSSGGDWDRARRKLRELDEVLARYRPEVDAHFEAVGVYPREVPAPSSSTPKGSR